MAGGLAAVEVSEVAVEGVDDAVVAGGFVGPAALVGVVAERPDVVALVFQDVGSFGVGDEVVALFADVGVGAGSGATAPGAGPAMSAPLTPREPGRCSLTATVWDSVPSGPSTR